jgi:hypothetical protein
MPLGAPATPVAYACVLHCRHVLSSTHWECLLQWMDVPLGGHGLPHLPLGTFATPVAYTCVLRCRHVGSHWECLLQLMVATGERGTPPVGWEQSV